MIFRLSQKLNTKIKAGTLNVMPLAALLKRSFSPPSILRNCPSWKIVQLPRVDVLARLFHPLFG
jgi:hypothetical protein